MISTCLGAPNWSKWINISSNYWLSWLSRCVICSVILHGVWKKTDQRFSVRNKFKRTDIIFGKHYCKDTVKLLIQQISMMNDCCSDGVSDLAWSSPVLLNVLSFSDQLCISCTPAYVIFSKCYNWPAFNRLNLKATVVFLHISVFV